VNTKDNSPPRGVLHLEADFPYCHITKDHSFPHLLGTEPKSLTVETNQTYVYDQS